MCELAGALEVWRLANIARGLAPSPTRVARVQAKLANPEALLAVVRDEQTVIAMALTEPYREGEGTGEIVPSIGHVSMVFVTPERQRQGVGRQLLLTLHDEMRGLGWEHSSLWARASNIPARRLYEHFGYVPIGDRKLLTDSTEIVRYRAALRHEPT